MRLSNAYGQNKLRIGGAHLAIRDTESKIVPSTDRTLTFNGSESTTIAIGAIAISDPIHLNVAPNSDLAISVYLPDSLLETFQITGHGTGRQTNYLSPAGNFVDETEFPVSETVESFLIVNGIDVLAPADTGGIVALGDSLTDCNLSTVDANYRWPDQLARRLQMRHEAEGGRLLGVMNQGIGGNRILHDVRGDSCLRRFDRDVIAQPGVTHAIVFLGINDIRNRYKKPGEEVTGQEIIDGMAQLAARGRAAGIKMIAGTMLTFEDENYNPPPGLKGLYTEEGEATRQAVNTWIRDTSDYDAVIDFEKALRDPNHPTQMLPKYDCGDHLHPGDEGYLHMGDVIDLALFDD